MRKGYKKTVIGEIPINWEVKKFIDETELLTCGVAATPVYVEKEIGVPFLSAQNVRNGKVVFDKFKYISKKHHNELTKNNKPQKKDILYSRVGAKFGEAGVVEHEFEFSVYVSLTHIRVKPTSDPYFIKFLLNSQYVKNLAYRSVFQGAGVPNLNVKVVREFILALPPLPEQQKIADILSTVDAKIEVIAQQITETQELKKGLMLRLLTKGIGHTQFKDSALGEIPLDWEVVKLGDIADVTAGGTPSTKEPDFWGGDIPWMNSGDINLRRIKAVEGRITELGLNNSSTKLIPSNSVLMALAGQGKTRGKVAVNEFSLCTNQSLATIYNFKNTDYEFIFQNLESRYSEIRKMSTGDGGRGGLNLTIIKSIPIALPPLGEQNKISKILISFDEKLEVLSEKKTEYQELKKGLMQQLLTGKIRVI